MYKILELLYKIFFYIQNFNLYYTKINFSLYKILDKTIFIVQNFILFCTKNMIAQKNSKNQFYYIRIFSEYVVNYSK